MRICFLSSVHPPLDKRVFDKEAISLAKQGFEVIHLAPAGQSQRYDKNGVSIQTYRRANGLVGRLLQIPRLYRLAAGVKADCYHCNEVDSWLVGILLKVTRGTKVVFDVHEHYPSMFAESRFPRWSHGLVQGAIRFVYSALTPSTDRIVLAKQSIAGDFSKMKTPIVVVQNFAAVRYGSQAREHRERDSVIITHLGLFGRERGWPQLLEAMAMTKYPDIRLQVIGTFNDGSQAAFEDRARELGLQDRVSVENWLPFDEAYQRLTHSDVGLVLFQPGIQNNEWALPHKLFDYMMAGLPVIVPSFAQEVANIVRTADCGITIDPSDPVQIAQALDALAGAAHVRSRLGSNGRNAVLTTYNWEAEASKLELMYGELAGLRDSGD